LSEPERRRGAAKLTSRAPEREHRSFRALGVAVAKLAAPILARRGGGILVRLKAEWPEIVGPEWAEVSWPTMLGRDGVLKLRAAPGAALDLQHRAPLLIERINLFFGCCVVGRLALVQGPLPLASAPPQPVVPALSEDDAKALDRRLSEVTDPDLHAALVRLGTAVRRAQR